MPKTEKPTCPVCMDTYTDVIRQPIQCSFCPHATCRQCTSRYLLTTLNDPHCMECKREWNREFIDTKLTQTFRKGALKHHRRRVLMDRERGRLPAMQVFVEAQMIVDRNGKQVSILRAERKRLKQERNRIQAEAANQSFEELSRQLEPIHRELSTKKSQIKALDRQFWQARAILSGHERPEAREFIMKCPSEGCRGFLSSAWKCGTCEKFFCSDCHAQKAGARDDAHICNEDAKATAAMIRKETKACPKCGIRISKIDGCDQMWCTGCHTTFSWNTGQILLNTVVHNPHYYEYLRRTNGGVIPREAGDVPCGGLPNGYLFTRLVQGVQQIQPTTKLDLYAIHRCLTDVLHVRLPRFPLRAPANGNREVDVSYLMKNLSEEEWGTKLEQMETQFERKKEIGLILQTFVHIGSEKLTTFYNEHERMMNREKMTQDAKRIVSEMEGVRNYINKSLLQKGAQMGIVVPQITQQYVYTWATREQIKAEKKNLGVVEAEQNDGDQIEEHTEEDPPIAPANPIVVPEEVTDEEQLINVEIGGELVEMTLAQARAMMQ